MSVSALIKNGTTVAPGFQRPSGQGELVRLLLILFNVSHNTPSQKGSAKCPSTHPHSLSDGLKCCSKFVRSSSCTEGGPATLKLQFEDSANCCDSADTYDCPASVVAQGRVCTSADISIVLQKTSLEGHFFQSSFSFADDSDYGSCPDDNSPLAYGSQCCPNYKRSSASECSGSGAVISTDPVECCTGTPVRKQLFGRRLIVIILNFVDGMSQPPISMQGSRDHLLPHLQFLNDSLCCPDLLRRRENGGH